ncbi:MAG: esterase FrsA [Moritella dasanensis]|jgi:esterase FrsA
MKKLLSPLLLSSMFTLIMSPVLSLSAQAQTTDANIASHSSFKNNLDEIQQDFYRGLRFEDWTYELSQAADLLLQQAPQLKDPKAENKGKSVSAIYKYANWPS